MNSLIKDYFSHIKVWGQSQWKSGFSFVILICEVINRRLVLKLIFRKLYIPYIIYTCTELCFIQLIFYVMNLRSTVASWLRFQFINSDSNMQTVVLPINTFSLCSLLPHNQYSTQFGQLLFYLCLGNYCFICICTINVLLVFVHWTYFIDLLFVINKIGTFFKIIIIKKNLSMVVL